jgi:putative colanic acid biosynthesis UDP-glucose lipid carrier transferase
MNSIYLQISIYEAKNETTLRSETYKDPRVTTIGRFMRKTSVDELPQFLNVFIWRYVCSWSKDRIYGRKIQTYGNKIKNT